MGLVVIFYFYNEVGYRFYGFGVSFGFSFVFVGTMLRVI